MTGLPIPPTAAEIRRLYRDDPAEAHERVEVFERELADAWENGAREHYKGDREAFLRDAGYTEARATLRTLIKRRRKRKRGDDTPCAWESPEALAATVARLNDAMSAPTWQPMRLRRANVPMQRRRLRGVTRSRGSTRQRRSSSSSRTSSADPGPGSDGGDGPGPVARPNLTAAGQPARYTYGVIDAETRGVAR
jgi:hypothetical protein